MQRSESCGSNQKCNSCSYSLVFILLWHGALSFFLWGRFFAISPFKRPSWATWLSGPFPGRQITKFLVHCFFAASGAFLRLISIQLATYFIPEFSGRSKIPLLIHIDAKNLLCLPEIAEKLWLERGSLQAQAAIKHDTKLFLKPLFTLFWHFGITTDVRADRIY